MDSVGDLQCSDKGMYHFLVHPSVLLAIQASRKIFTFPMHTLRKGQLLNVSLTGLRGELVLEGN